MIHNYVKQTLAGELPKEWEITKLEDIVEVHDSERIPLSKMERSKRKGIYPYCGANGIIDYIDGYIFDGEYVLLAEDGGDYTKFGNSAYIMSGKFWVNNHAHIIKAITKKSSNLFLLYSLNFLDIRRYIVGSTRTKLNQQQMREIKIPLPPISEQQKIAEILTTVDDSIQKVEAAISKIERIKKGLMQKLLTKGIGHVKFKDTKIGRIPEEWEVVRFKDRIVLQRGHDLPEKQRTEGRYPIIGSNGVVGYHNEFISEGPGVIIGRSGTLGKVYYSQENYWPLNTSLFVKNFINCHEKFVYYFLQNFNILRFSAGTSIPTLNRNYIHPIKITFPKKIEEQKKIAEILATVDKKLELEGQRKEKLERIKKGLMNDLLTGRKRVEGAG